MGKKLSRLVLSLLVSLFMQLEPVAMAHVSTVSAHGLSVSSHHHSAVSSHHALLDEATMSSSVVSPMEEDMAGKCCATHYGFCDLVTLAREYNVPQRHEGRRALFYDEVQELPSYSSPALLRPPIFFVA
ncbi:hypothetical protein GS501_08980 [Saccharibacter sp. 17.LH.SD]|uniref:hypothetical protein n=1 Tax=Saccharibacter sp. 17.LH.SD TaxID=2689393 RepID=UPI001369A253|nr:hypothetical protein [Saccharibacter sp. 17.LH.SD]MXV45165.1 hypothetical protein [Saccharibacter sp. 17.LH.SD]